MPAWQTDTSAATEPQRPATGNERGSTGLILSDEIHY
jgi:hypothetical protein